MARALKRHAPVTYLEQTDGNHSWRRKLAVSGATVLKEGEDNVMHSYLVADIGGTNARCARAVVDAARHTAQLHDTRVYRCKELTSVDALLTRYRDESSETLPKHVCLAVAGPVHGDRITLTNNDWNFSVEQLRRRHELVRLAVINDLAAAAYSTTMVTEDEIHALRARGGRTTAARVVIGAGTGLGVAGLAHRDGQWHAVASEAGHASFAPRSIQDFELLKQLRRGNDDVSWESLISGPGLVRLYNAMAQLGDQPAAPLSSHEIANRARAGQDPLCEETATVFCRLIAQFAHDAALWFCALGGVYLTGDVFRAFEDRLSAPEFSRHFQCDGPMAEMIEGVGVSLVLAAQPGLIGAAAHAYSFDQPIPVDALSAAS